MSQYNKVSIQALEMDYGIEEYFKNLEKINKYFCVLFKLIMENSGHI